MEILGKISDNPLLQGNLYFVRNAVLSEFILSQDYQVEPRYQAMIKE
jgi:hypothetical protein